MGLIAKNFLKIFSCPICLLPIENYRKPLCLKPFMQKISYRQVPSNLPLEINKNAKNRKK